MVGTWDKFEAVHCPKCRNHQMRFFARSDGYMKWFCVDCKCSIEEAPSSMNDKLNDNGFVDTTHKPGEVLKIGCEYDGCPEFLRISGDKNKDEKTLNSHGWMFCATGQNPFKLYCRLHAQEHCAKHGLNY